MEIIFKKKCTYRYYHHKGIYRYELKRFSNVETKSRIINLFIITFQKIQTFEKLPLRLILVHKIISYETVEAAKQYYFYDE